MKSGRKILLKLMASEDLQRDVHQLGNGDLRSLLKRMAKRPLKTPETRSSVIYGLAMVEAADRFTEGKGQKIL